MVSQWERSVDGVGRGRDVAAVRSDCAEYACVKETLLGSDE
jgi:hypothetical protein